MAAPRGNTNALRHGLYARSYTKEQISDLGKMPFNDIRQEIAALRVVISKALLVLDAAEPATAINADGAEKPSGADERIAYAKLLASTTTAITQLAQLARTQAILSGDDSPLNRALDDALSGLDPYYTHDDTNPPDLHRV